MGGGGGGGGGGRGGGGGGVGGGVRVCEKFICDVKSDSCGWILPITPAKQTFDCSVCISQLQVGKHTRTHTHTQAAKATSRLGVTALTGAELTGASVFILFAMSVS